MRQVLGALALALAVATNAAAGDLRLWQLPPTPLIFPGPGGSWPTISQPAAVGSSAERVYPLMTIGGLDEVQYQTLADVTEFCGMWWHQPTAAQNSAGMESNIDHIDFIIDNGLPTSVSSRNFVTARGVSEYCAKVNPRDYSDGLHELRVLAYPITGVPLVLQGDVETPDTLDRKAYSLYFRTNFNGTLPAPLTEWVSPSGLDTNPCTQAQPCLTLLRARTKLKSDAAAAGRGTEVGDSNIYMQPGTYCWPSAANDGGLRTFRAWLHVGKAPGAVGDVIINNCTPSGGPLIENVHLHDVRVEGDTNANGLKSGLTTINGRPVKIWLDKSVFAGGGIIYDDQPVRRSPNYPGGIWMTDVEIYNYGNGVRDANLQRRVYVHDIASDAFTGSYALVNVRTDHINHPTSGCPGGSGYTCAAHGDVYQLVTTVNRVTFDGYISGTTLTVTAMVKDAGEHIRVGYTLWDSPSYTSSVTAFNTVILAQLTSTETDGSLGKKGTYLVSVSQTRGSATAPVRQQTSPVYYNRWALKLEALNTINSQCLFPTQGSLHDTAFEGWNCDITFNNNHIAFQQGSGHFTNFLLVRPRIIGGLGSSGVRSGISSDMLVVNGTCGPPNPAPFLNYLRMGGTC
jgi:hypothetical protein